MAAGTPKFLHRKRVLDLHTLGRILELRFTVVRTTVRLPLRLLLRFLTTVVVLVVLTIILFLTAHVVVRC